MKLVMRRLLRMAAALALLLGIVDQARAGLVWDAAADYDAGWAAHANPNGAWNYGWSSSLTSALTDYTRTRLVPTYPSFEAWDDPNHNFGFTPFVYKNTGSAYNDGNIDVPSDALILHGGGPSGNDYSQVVWTAPSSGNFTLDATFTGRQTVSGGAYMTDVYVLENGSTLFTSLLTFDGDIGSFNGVLSLSAGDQISFAVGIQGTGFHGETTQLGATITSVSAVPEPASLTLFALGAIVSLGYAWPRRRTLG